MDIWRANVHTQSITTEKTPEAWKKLGGRGLIARILLDEVPARCDPLGWHNKLIFAPGLLVGHMLSSCDRLSVGGKSPLTGGIKESNAGGTTGLQLTYLGIKALIVEGQPEHPGWWVLYLSKSGSKFEPADDLQHYPTGSLVGMGVHETAQQLITKYGNKVALAIIGPGGEMLLSAAGIQNLDKDHEPSRIAARGGLGAVMGSKRLKAIVIDARDGEKPYISQPENFKRARKIFTDALMAHPQTAVYRDFGTAAIARMSNSFGGLPTRNFSSGQFEGVETISGEYLRKVILERCGEGDASHACMPGCTIRSSNVYDDVNGQKIVSPLEYETIGLMGSNLGIDDLDKIAALNYIVDDLGLDSIEIGAALGVAAEAGLMEFGDFEKARSLLYEIRDGTPLGRILGNGAGMTGKIFGVKRVPVVKNQAMSAYEPRAIKGTGVTYATSPQGADHTSGLTIRAKIDHLNPEGQVGISRTVQINNAGFDSLGACIFASFGFFAAQDSIKDLINARYDWEVESDFLQLLGKETLLLEREFNKKAGFTSADDRIPEWMMEEPLPPHNTIFDVPEEELDNIYNF